MNMTFVPMLALVPSLAVAQDVPKTHAPDAKTSSALDPQAKPQASATAGVKTTVKERGLVTVSEHAEPGYTLFAPLLSDKTYLVDLGGKIVHEWRSDAAPGQSVYLLANGNLLRAERVDNDTFFGGGQGGRIRELAPDSSVVWEYTASDDKRCLHHDIKPLPNGHVLAISWEYRTKDEALAAGRDAKLVHGDSMWPDMVMELEPTGKSGARIVWEWHAWDHLIQDTDPARANSGQVAAHPERIDINADRDSNATRDGGGARDRNHLRAIGYAGGAPEDEDADGKHAGPPDANRAGAQDQRRPGPPDGSPDGPPDGAPDGVPGAMPRGPGGTDGMGGPGGMGDWLHTNAIDYRADVDVIVLSSRVLNEIWVIDHSTTTTEAASSKGGRWGKGGDLLARWGNPRTYKNGTAADQKLFGQHNIQWIRADLPGAGNLLVFNNGGSPAHKDSSVDEIAFPIDAEHLKKGVDAQALASARVVWTYSTPEINSSHISGAQRLANGNTLICSGEKGRVVEVDTQGKIAWDYLNAFGGDHPMRGGPGGSMRRSGRPGGPNGVDGARPDRQPPNDGAPSTAGKPGDKAGQPSDKNGAQPDGSDDALRPPRGGLGGMPGGPRGPAGPGGRGGPGGTEPFGLFRAERYSPQDPGLIKLLATSQK